MNATYQRRKRTYKSGPANALFPSYSTERMQLQEVLKISSARFNTCLGTSCHGLSNAFKDPGIVVDTLTGIYNALVKCPRCEQELNIHNGF
jgi:hypothetical protein